MQTLFNRLMFVHFLSRKGWLSINDDKDYLRALWIDYRNTSAPSPTGIAPNFYRDRLRLLFFTGLNNPDSRDLSRGASPLIGSVPFLNGGLFTEGEHDAEDSPIVVPDSVIEGALAELFEKFNFTVMESTPFDIEVAVDPEMLGKVFEELVNERHDSGAYYTPRPVVAFMCREALKGYLEGKDTGVSADAIAAYIENRDTGGISVDAARRIGAALDEITVVDPACGSGAFLLGMMQELVDLQTTLYNAGVDSKSLHALKLHIIERNLYGVDIDEFAVNIAMLRLWLSLAIDFGGDTPPALPNLDFKIVCGDSLLGPDPSPDNYPDLFRHQVINVADKLATLKGDYMNESERFEKQRLHDEVEALEHELTAALSDAPSPEGAVDWRVQFAEVFAPYGGFDVAIANPPYVNMVTMDRTNPEYRKLLRANFATAIGGFDIFVPFVERALQVMAKSGLYAYITPNKLLAAEYAAALRDYVLSKAQLLSITDLSEVSLFDTAVYPVVTIASKTPQSDDSRTVGIFRTTGTDHDMQQVVPMHSASLAVARHIRNLWSPLLDPDAPTLLPMFAFCERLGDIAVVSASATVAEAYKWKDAIQDSGDSLHSIDPERYRPFIVSGNISQYSHSWGKRPTQYIKKHYNSPVIDTKHSAVNERRLSQIRAQKLIISGMSKKITCVYDELGIAAGKSTVLVIGQTADDNAFICGLLNSEFMQRFYIAMFRSLSLAGGFLRFGTPQIRELPIPKANQKERALIADLVRQRMAADTSNHDKIEKEINEAVSTLFTSVGG